MKESLPLPLPIPKLPRGGETLASAPFLALQLIYFFVPSPSPPPLCALHHCSIFFQLSPFTITRDFLSSSPPLPSGRRREGGRKKNRRGLSKALGGGGRGGPGTIRRRRRKESLSGFWRTHPRDLLLLRPETAEKVLFECKKNRGGAKWSESTYSTY